MSAANVEFLKIDCSPCPEEEQPQRFTFRCVGYNRDRHPLLKPEKCAGLLIANSGHGIPRHPQGQNGGRPQWEWDGNRETPTFNPSVNCEGHCGWHGYIRSGRCVDTNGTDSA